MEKIKMRKILKEKLIEKIQSIDKKYSDKLEIEKAIIDKMHKRAQFKDLHLINDLRNIKLELNAFLSERESLHLSYELFLITLIK